MLDAQGRNVCMEILKLINEEDLLSLGRTVSRSVSTPLTLNTHGSIPLSSQTCIASSYENIQPSYDFYVIHMVADLLRPDAIERILMFTSEPAELLQRRKVKREVLQTYLMQLGQVDPEHLDKPHMVKRILELSGLSSNFVPALHLSLDYLSDSIMGHLEQFDRIPMIKDNVDVDMETQTCDDGLDKDSEDILAVFATQFVEWFYRIIPSSNTPASAWSAAHFWPNCQLTLQLCSDGSTPERTVHVEGAEPVATTLGEILLVERFVLLPNLLRGGVTAKMDRHGLTLVEAHGILHRENTPSGVFSQNFGLVQDPLQNHSWRIKFTNLFLKQSGSKGDFSPAGLLQA